MGEPAIQTERLSRSFGSVTALRDLNLRVPRGVVYGLIGPNGAGKTTTLRLLLGLLQPSGGRSLVLSRDPMTHGHEVRCSIGAVLEPCGLYERMTARENLDYFGRVWHMPKSDRVARTQELLEQMGLWDRRDEVITGWGRGYKQRLAIARSLMHRPALLLMDEPNAGLDAAAVERSSRYLHNLASQVGLTVLLATNSLAMSESTCHSITILNKGRTLATGRVDHICRQGCPSAMEIDGRGFSDEVVSLLLRRPEVESAQRVSGGVSLQLAARVDTAPLVSLLVESGVAITEVRKLEPTLRSAVETLLRNDLEAEADRLTKEENSA